jgi:ADP-heptose:LPS heptosyltransferase
LIKKGYKVYQLSGPGQPHIRNTTFVRGTYFESCKKMLSTDFLITCDSGMPWVASAYNHPMIGLYSAMYNPLVGTTKNWQPVNPNAVYLESYSANSIDLNLVLSEIDKKIEETT